MGNSKVIFGDETLIDLTGDTVTPDTMLAGTTAHNRSGEQIVGTASSVPAGGTTDQVLAKNSNTDGDTKWMNVAMPRDIAPTESTSTSSKAYAVGDLLYYEGVLYKVTRAIAQGGSIVTSGSGKNVEVTTVEDEIQNCATDADLFDATTVISYKNLCEKIEQGTFDSYHGGVNASATNRCRVRGFIPYTSGVSYVFSFKSTINMQWLVVWFDKNDGTGSLITQTGWKTSGGSFSTSVANAKYFRIIIAPVTNQSISPSDFSDAQLEVGSTPTTFQPYHVPIKDYASAVPAMQENGAYNWLNNTATSQVVDGVTFTVNTDKSITLSNTATAATGIVIGFVERDVPSLIGKDIKVSLGYTAAMSSIQYGNIRFLNSSDVIISQENVTYDATFTVPANTAKIRLSVLVINGKTATGTIYPMIYDARLVNPPYQPFTMTNRELTDNFAGIKYLVYEDNFPNTTSDTYYNVGLPSTTHAVVVGVSYVHTNGTIYEFVNDADINGNIWMHGGQLRIRLKTADAGIVNRPFKAIIAYL